MYFRVSTSDQDCSSQRLELTGYCQRQDWTAVGEWSDVMSGAKAVRPGLESLLERCAAGGIDAIAVVKLDRLGRSVLNVARLVEQLDGLGVALICTSQGIDTRKDNPCGRFQLSMLSAVAAFERDLIRERTKAGLAVAKANGKILGRPSPALVGVDIPAVVSAWRIATGGIGVRNLAHRLGGVSPSTAARLAEENP